MAEFVGEIRFSVSVVADSSEQADERINDLLDLLGRPVNDLAGVSWDGVEWFVVDADCKVEN